MTHCVGGLYCCIVACADLRNGTGHRTVTKAASLLLTSGLAKYEVGLHSDFFRICVSVCLVFVYVCDGMYAG